MPHQGPGTAPSLVRRSLEHRGLLNSLLVSCKTPSETGRYAPLVTASNCALEILSTLGSSKLPTATAAFGQPGSLLFHTNDPRGVFGRNYSMVAELQSGDNLRKPDVAGILFEAFKRVHGGLERSLQDISKLAPKAPPVGHPLGWPEAMTTKELKKKKAVLDPPPATFDHELVLHPALSVILIIEEIARWPPSVVATSIPISSSTCPQVCRMSSVLTTTAQTQPACFSVRLPSLGPCVSLYPSRHPGTHSPTD